MGCLHSLFPEARGDVLEVALVGAAVEALVGGGFLQGAQVLDERADLDVVEVILVDEGGDDGAAAIPGDAQLGVFLVDVLRQQVDTPWVVVAAHEGDAGKVGTVFSDKVVDGLGGQRQADILP